MSNRESNEGTSIAIFCIAFAIITMVSIFILSGKAGEGMRRGFLAFWGISQ